MGRVPWLRNRLAKGESNVPRTICSTLSTAMNAVHHGTYIKLSLELFSEMRRLKQKYGVVTMCVGTGQGAASVFELLN